MRKKKENKKIIRLFTSVDSRMVSITVSIFAFIFVMAMAIFIELYKNEESYVSLYQEQQELFVQQLSNDFLQMYKDGKTDKDVIQYLSKNVKASGSRFLVFIKDEDVLFAKNEITTEKLSKLLKKDYFYKKMKEQNVTIQISTFEFNQSDYELAVVSDLYTVKMEGNLIEHKYYILMMVVITSLVLLSLLLKIVGLWNRTQKQLEGTQKELNIRNEKMEKFSEEVVNETSNKMDMEEYIKDSEFYNIYTLRMLLQKSEDVQLKPLHFIYLNIVMENRYFSKKEIFVAMRKIQKTLRTVEIMGEIRKGQFVILVYKTSEEDVEKRVKVIQEICRNIENEDRIKINCRLQKEDDQVAIERFEETK